MDCDLVKAPNEAEVKQNPRILMRRLGKGNSEYDAWTRFSPRTPKKDGTIGSQRRANFNHPWNARSPIVIMPRRLFLLSSTCQSFPFSFLYFVVFI